MTVQKITPFLWFHNNAKEAMSYYVGVFPDSQQGHVQSYPDESLDPHFQGMSGKVITGEFFLSGQRFLCLDGGPEFTFNEAISFLVECKDQAELDYYWDKLSHVPGAEQCGWCKDKFGVSWQIVPADMGALLQSPGAVQAMMQMKKIVIADLQTAR